MRYTPILFSTPMVQALLAGKKIMTRRTKRLEEISLLATEIVKSSQWQKQGDWVARFKYKGEENYEVTNVIKCPYGQVGDVLWVREVFCPTGSNEYLNQETKKPFFYKADIIDPELIKNVMKDFNWKWKPSIHMKKEACRLFLEITNIKVERLQDIGENDAVREGISNNETKYYDYLRKDFLNESAYHSFFTLWESINGKESWQANPWVWVIEFKQISKPDNFR